MSKEAARVRAIDDVCAAAGIEGAADFFIRNGLTRADVKASIARVNARIVGASQAPDPSGCSGRRSHRSPTRPPQAAVSHEVTEDTDMADTIPDDDDTPYERQIRELCALAGCPEKADTYIHMCSTVDSVRTALFNAKAMHRHDAIVEGSTRKGWARAVAKANASTTSPATYLAERRSRRHAPQAAHEPGGGWDRAVSKANIHSMGRKR